MIRDDKSLKYVQLQNTLRAEILQGKYLNGDKIPSEPQLMRQYHVTRTTIRKALENLVQEGLLHKEHGRGTFVDLRPINHSMWNFSGFTDYARSRRCEVISKVLEAAFITQSERTYFKLVRVRGLKETQTTTWCTIDTSMTPVSLFPGIEQHDFSCTSLYDVMKHEYQIYPHHAELELHAVASTKLYQELLRYRGNTPLLSVDGMVFDRESREIEHVHVVYNPQVHMKVTTAFTTP